MPYVAANDIRIEYEIDGPEDGPVLLLIHGVGAQLTRWPRKLCDGFAGAGYRVVRFDNRDIGLSSHMDGAPLPDIASVIAAKAVGQNPVLPYTLGDLAGDAFGLLDALRIGGAHVLGVSLGGMIAQVMAIRHPARVRSLTLMMSQSGNPDLPPARPEALAVLSRPAPDPAVDPEGYVGHQLLLNRTVGSPAYPVSEDELRQFALASARRSWNPQGPVRQLAAGRGAPDRREELRKLAVPTLVIHGADDPLIPVECGEELAGTIAGSWFLRLGGMGHDLPAELLDLFIAAVAANCTRSGARYMGAEN